MLVGKTERKTPLRRPGRRWRMILDWLRKYGGKLWTGYIGLRTGTRGGLL